MLKDQAIAEVECEQRERLVDAILEVHSTEAMDLEASDKGAV
jgi:hypothetical protein